MDENDKLDARLQALRGRRGQELVKGLVEEITGLNRDLAALKRELAALADYQAARDRWLVLDEAEAGVARLPRLVVIEPDQLLRPHDGFYGVEHATGNVPFRWTGPSTRFSFDLFIDRTHGADVRLEALNCIDYEIQKALLLMVDGEAAPITVAPREMGFVASARLPARAGGQATNLVFVLPAVLVPPESVDRRELGIAFGRLAAVARTAESDAQDREAKAAGLAVGQDRTDLDTLDIDTEELTSAAIS